MFTTIALLALSRLTSFTAGHDAKGVAFDVDQIILNDFHHRPLAAEEWTEKYADREDQPFSGPITFSHIPQTRCLNDTATKFDYAILGVPFDTAVSNRPGARFGPRAIRMGSQRISPAFGYDIYWEFNPYTLENVTVIDCGDVPVTPYDNAVALDQMKVAYGTLLNRPVANEQAHANSPLKALALDNKVHPRILTLGGDHTIVLANLRALSEIYGKGNIAAIHFDAHIDTWQILPTGELSEQARINHGTFFYVAYEEGLLATNNIHGGTRCMMEGSDLDTDAEVGFQIVAADDIFHHNVSWIIDRIRTRIGDSPVYLSLDIDVIDPGMAPATGTPETGGWSTREMKQIIRGLRGLNFIGADVVEVSGPYDGPAELTAIAAADIMHDFLSLLIASNEDSA